MPKDNTGSKPMIGIIVERVIKQALADEAWRQRTTQSALARELIIDGLKKRGVKIEAPQNVSA